MPSDKHTAGVEPRRIWTTTDAVRATLCLLGEPDWDDALKNKSSQKEQTRAWFRFDGDG